MFSENKAYVLLMYVLCGVAMAVWPIVAQLKTDRSTINRPKAAAINNYNGDQSVRKIFILLALIVVIASFATERTYELVFSILLLALILSIQHGRCNLVGLAAVAITLFVTLTLPWWTRRGNHLDISSVNFLFYAVIVIFLTRLLILISTPKDNRFKLLPFPFVWLLAYGLCAGILSFSTTIFIDSKFTLTLWHHWSAYIAPAELLLSGATLFHDFPAQYGLGPTSIIASVCGGDCWEGMYFLVALTTLCFACLIAAIALELSSDRWVARIVTLLICGLTCFFWTAYPPSVALPMMTPSVSGMRFLPALLLVAYLFFTRAIELSRAKLCFGHILWIVGSVWSPESAFYVTFVWWPYYLFIRLQQGALTFRLKLLVIDATRLTFIGIGLIFIGNLFFYLIYRKEPTLFGFLGYILNPPGPLPINFFGTVWYFVIVMIIGQMTSLALWRNTGDTHLFRRGFILQLLSYAVFSYFLGRSHDNNILNLLPFLLLVLLHAISARCTEILSRTSMIMVAALLGWCSLFGWETWRSKMLSGISSDVISFKPDLLLNSMTFSKLDLIEKSDVKELSVRTYKSERESAIEFIRSQYGEPVTVLDGSLLLVRGNPSQVWSGLHGLANYAEMASKQRREFVYKTATALKRTGWLLVKKDYDASKWLVDLDSSYDRAATIDFDTYYAIRFSPKTVY